LCLAVLLFIGQTYAWSRSDCERVAEAWKAGDVPYAQSTRYNAKQFVSTGKGPYRSDCSGFVSAAWDLPAPGATTRSITYNTVSKDELTRCDALLTPGHVALFWGWSDAAKTKPIVVEEYTTGKTCEQRTWTSTRSAKFIRKKDWGSTVGGAGSPPPTSPPPQSSSGGGGTCRVTASALNVRSCGTTDCSVLRSISEGATVTKTGQSSSSGFVQISSPLSGWVSAQFLSCNSANRQSQEDDDSNQRNAELFPGESEDEGDSDWQSQARDENDAQSSSGSPNVGLIVGVSIGCVVGVILIAGLVAYFVARKQNVVESA